MNQATNGIDVGKAQRFVGEIEKCYDELLSERGEYMQRCKSIRERIGGWKEQATEAGIPRKALKAILKERDLKAKISALTEDLDIDERSQLDMLREALGDFGELPLGAAAYVAAGEAPPPVAASSAPKRGRGRSRKDAVAPVPVAAGAVSGAAALDSLINPVEAPGEAASDDHADVRPAFLRRADEEAAAANEAALANLKALN